MSIIAVKGIPAIWNIVRTMKTLKNAINGPFDVLNFAAGKGKTKTCYIRLAHSLDPARTVQKITKTNFGKFGRFFAFIPKEVPNMQLAKKKRALPKKLRNQIGDMEAPHQVIQRTHLELILEIQYKYPGLFNLSYKTGHKLLDTISKIIFERLKLTLNNAEARDSCFRASSIYRRTHPHAGDFKDIQTALHALQDASGAPRLNIQEKELLQQPKTITNDKIPQVDLQQASNKYAQKVVNAMTAHIQALNTAPTQLDNEHETARKKVREEMKKLMPYLPVIVKQVVAKHFFPQSTPMHRIRIYGEPFLPSKEAMTPFVRRYHNGASRVIRHPRMYNLLLFKVTDHQYNTLMAMDGTVVNGAKLVIRSDMPTYEPSQKFRSEMSVALGGPSIALPEFDNEIESDGVDDGDMEE